MVNEFGVVLIAGLTLFGAAILFSGEYSDFTVSQEEEEYVFLEESPGEVGEAVRDSRRINFGEVTVGDMRGDVKVFDELDRTTYNAWRSASTIETNYEAVQPEGGSVEFEVVGREGSGSLWVEVNGERIYEETANPGEEVQVDIPSQNLDQGENNIEIGNSLGSFFSSSEYRLRHISVSVNDRTFHDYQGSFQVYDYELTDFIESEINFDITESVINNPLEIRVNGERVYSETTPRGERAVELDREILNTGANTIQISTGEMSEYRLGGTSILLRYMASAESTAVDVNFDLTDDEVDRAGSSDTEVVLDFDYQSVLPETSEMNVTLNQENRTVFPTSGDNEVVFDDETLQNENNLRLETEDAYIMENLRLVSRRIE